MGERVRVEAAEPSVSNPPLDSREVRIASEDALDALVHFGRLSRQWNAPDDEHTRYQLRAVLDAAVEEVFCD